MPTEFKVLGSLAVLHDGVDRTPGPPKVRQLLALLLMRSNQVLSIDTIVEELWGENPPPSAVTTTQTYVYQMRKLIAAHGISNGTGELLVTRNNGYQFRVDPGQVDEKVFEGLFLSGRLAARQDRHREASAYLQQALALWSGPALDDVARGRQLQAHAVHLTEMRNRATELRIESDLQLGLHREMIGELRVLVAEHPLNEWLHGKLIQALALAGRRSEALGAYQELRTILDEELGLEPSPESQRLQYQVLG